MLISRDTGSVKYLSSLGCTVCPAPRGGPGRRWRSLLLDFGFVFAQGIPAQFDPVGIVNDAIQDRVAQSGIPDHRRLPLFSID